MKVAIMQPYFMPYIGYFQLMNSVDKFIVYDNIQFIKKGWIHRNRIIQNDKDSYISLPLKKASDYLNVNQRFLAESFNNDSIKLIRKIEGAYKKAPYFNDVFSIVIKIITCNQINLFEYIYNSLTILNSYLNINVEIIKSSNLKTNIEDYKGKEKVLAICKELEATHYINPIGGQELYTKTYFKDKELALFFIKSNSITYKQFDNEFIPWLSIIDVMMFNSVENIRSMLNQYTLI